jgi:hypothetical protein
MSIRTITILGGIFISLVLLVSYLEARTWTSKSGTFKIEAEYVDGDGDKVVLRKQDGTLVKPRINQLSDSDQAFINSKQESDNKNPFATVSEIKQPEINLTAEDNHRTVRVEGVGSTFEDAKKDAFRNAVSQVVGTLVDAQTHVTREGIIEQMLTASNAYIVDHKIVSRKQNDGLWKITMDAVVENQAVQKRLTPPKEETIVFDGASITGKSQTKEESANAVLLLAKILKDQNYPYSIMEVTGEMEKKPIEKQGDSVTIRVNVTLKPNAEKFDEFRKKIEPILDKIALSKSNMTLKMNKDTSNNYKLDSLPNSDPDGKNSRSVFLHLNTSRNNNLTNTSWKSFELPIEAHTILSAYYAVVPCIEIELCNTENAVVTDAFVSNPCPRAAYGIINNCSNSINRGNFVKYHIKKGLNDVSGLAPVGGSEYFTDFLFSLFFGFDNSFVSSYVISRVFTLELSELASIKSLKIRIVIQNRQMDEFYKTLPEILKKMQQVKE